MSFSKICLVFVFVMGMVKLKAQSPRQILDFNKEWKFTLEDDSIFSNPDFNDDGWRTLSLPHDWSIEGKFDSTWPAGNEGGALPGGIGWYRKTFNTHTKGKRVYVEFDGIYRNSKVWINGHYLGEWPYGYTSFRYELTSWLKPLGGKNVIAVRVDNSLQPNSRWYTGSGIYRDVRLITTSQTAVRQWGTFITTPKVSKKEAAVRAEYDIDNPGNKSLKIVSTIMDADGKSVLRTEKTIQYNGKYIQTALVRSPHLWSVDRPYLYRMVTQVFKGNTLADEYCTPFGIREFKFDFDDGFFLNGTYMKILGVCQHHDLGALGAAFNISAAKRQLRILKEMGVNAIRMAHNPPAPQLLDLCDEMGFLVMDESFDMWAKKKNKYDYALDFPGWHQRDLEHMILRDRNHPSIIMWSIGNEIREQFDSSGLTITRELVKMVKNLDTTRPVTCALTETDPSKNFIYKSGALDIFGLNYKVFAYNDFQKIFPGVKMIASENVSGLASRGHYDMPSDSLRLWPPSSKYKYVPDGNPDYTVSAYDNVAAYWGTTHENNWLQVKRYKYVSGLFVWSGFDFLGEPVPYPYPARSSYYGVVDLAGFPKDVYYMYQSEWTNKPVLHIYPHWNWKNGQLVDVKVYYSKADEAELFLNGKSLGRKSKADTNFHVMWRVPFEPGELRVVSYHNNQKVLEKVIRTAGKPFKLIPEVENKEISLDKNELSFVSVRIEDKEGNMVPYADNLVAVDIAGPAEVAGMDNGYPAGLGSMRGSGHNAYNGRLVVMMKGTKRGRVNITLRANGLQSSETTLIVK